MTGKGTRKARLMDRAGVVTLVVQREEPPYQDVAVEGTVVETVRPDRWISTDFTGDV